MEELIDIENENTDQHQQETRKLIKPKELRQYIDAAEKWLKSGPYKGQESRWKQWERNMKYLMCVWPNANDDDVAVNLIFGNYNTVRPTLYFKNPKISVVPSKPDFEKEQVGTDEQGNPIFDSKKDPNTGHPILVDNYKAAKLLGLKINYELKELQFKKTLKRVLGDCLCPYGVGWTKWGYSTKTVGGHSNERDRQVTYWVKRVDPRNLVYDWMATSVEDARFFAERLILTRRQAVKEGFVIPRNYTCRLPEFLKNRSEKAKSGKNDDDLLIFWEFHDLENDFIYWTYDADLDSEQYNQYAKEPVEKPYPFDGSSYVPLVLNENNDDLIGISDVEPIEDQQKAINRLRTKQTKHVDNFGTLTKYEDGSLLQADIENIQKNNHGAFLKVQKGQMNGVVTDGTPAMGADNENMVRAHLEDARLTLGITDYMQGGAKSRTATEGNLIQNASNVRIEERRDVIYDFVIDNVRRLVALIQAFGEDVEFVNVADEEFDEDFMDVIKNEYGFNPKIPFLGMPKKDIQGEFHYNFSVEDMVTVPKEVQLQQWTQMIQMVGSNPLLMQAAEEEDISWGKVFKKLFELAGSDINEVKMGGPAQLDDEQENQMFLNGMEVPEPHRKDNNDKHILSHSRPLKEIEGQLQAIAEQIQQAQATVQQMQIQQDQMAGEAEQTGIDPATLKMPEIDPSIQKQIDELTMQGEILNNIARKIKIHIQFHERNRQKREMGRMGGTMGGGQPSMPQPGPSQQVAMRQEAQQIQ